MTELLVCLPHILGLQDGVHHLEGLDSVSLAKKSTTLLCRHGFAPLSESVLNSTSLRRIGPSARRSKNHLVCMFGMSPPPAPHVSGVTTALLGVSKLSPRGLSAPS